MSKALDSQRTYALIGTGGCGKTSLAEMLLFQSGVINRLGAIARPLLITNRKKSSAAAPSSPDSPLSSGTRIATSSWTSPATPTLPVTFPTC